MKSCRVVALFAITLYTHLLSAEPSAFGAGDLNNPNPYGLSSTETTLLETKKNLQKVVVKSNNQANEVDSLRERIDGLQTIIENISATSRENKLKLKSQEDGVNNKSEYDKRVAESIQVNSKDIEKINLQLAEISKLIDRINKTYVTKDEFNSLVSDVNKFKDLLAKELKIAPKSKNIQSKELSNAEIDTKAKDFYNKKLYKESRELYKELISKSYKPAYSHYMVGEIEYYTNNYSEAIAYFKSSATLYDKATYMPTLLLHTAISMEKSNDKKNAKIFYNAVMSQYPDSSQAGIAKKKLSSIK
ncbi:MAG TPA: tetratricopeptide repeat protein [Sulfurimonas sp.]|uniref:tetratricopeptide repeat protein n=1 Tax=Sulfurimonas sp. TaxID=2022749 RepID=UPI002BECC742|nr:tetratricopeptide repeat protein [Sulfurimonas sp.]HUH43355.1 tetratricopeptide repeat protein [Sulfurimonas sp.]